MWEEFLGWVGMDMSFLHQNYYGGDNYEERICAIVKYLLHKERETWFDLLFLHWKFVVVT